MPPKQKPGESNFAYKARCDAAVTKAAVKRAAKVDAIESLRRLARAPGASTPAEVRHAAVTALGVLSPGPVPDIDQGSFDDEAVPGVA